MRGLSGAVTALILVIASVVIALIVVGFAFGLFGAVSKQGAVTPAGTSYVKVVNGTATVVMELHNSGSAVQVNEVTINGVPLRFNSTVIINTGLDNVTITGSFSSKLYAGESVTVDLWLANGQVVAVPSVVE